MTQPPVYTIGGAPSPTAVQRDVFTEPSGEHFNKQGHGVHHLKGQVIERVRSNDPYILKAREHMYIQKFDKFRNGLNQEP